MPFGQVEIDRDSLRQFMAAVRQSVDTELPKRLGQANRSVGEKFIYQWLRPKPDQAAVGKGAGAAVRPSASKRDVILRVGGAHRAGHTPYKQWGRRPVNPFEVAPPRPYIRQSADDHLDEIQEAWLEAVQQACSPPFEIGD